jgi:sugar lactone lactonase YvrE
MTTIAGTGRKGYTGDGGAATAATFNGPKGICTDRAGNLYIVDTENHAIRRWEKKTGILTTVVRDLNRPHGVTLAPDGSLWIADTLNHRMQRVTLPS